MCRFWWKKSPPVEKMGGEKAALVCDILTRARQHARNVVPIGGHFERTLDLPSYLRGPHEIMYGLMVPNGIMSELAQEAPRYGLRLGMMVEETIGFIRVE